MPWYESAKQFSVRKQRPLDPLLGRSIDRYLRAGKLGEGGMGAVYVAIQRPLNREVALKVISGLEMTQTTISRFEREARAIAVLDHPNIVKLHDYGVGELEFRVPYMALEYVKHGKTLRRALAQMRQDGGGLPIPGDVVLSIFRQVLHALETAHGVGIVHRDMKPDNVMLAPVAGNPHFVKVLDFGLAKAVSEVSGFDGTVSRTGLVLGTPLYMAPEQAPLRGRRSEVDGRADLYAVGVMAYEVFTGVRPFDGETPIEVLSKKVDPDYRPLGFPEARYLPRSLKAFLARSFAADPDGRYASAADMLVAFEDALSGRRATAVGMAGGRPGSSDERPATPESPREALGQAPRDAPPEPTTPLGDSSQVAAYSAWPEAPPSTVRRSWRTIGRRSTVVIGALVAACGVLAAFNLAVRERASPQPLPGVPPGAAEDAQVAADDVAEPDPGPVEPPPAPAVEPPAPPAPEPGPEPQPKPADLRVRFESAPQGADVFVGGSRLGTAPFETSIEGKPGPREFAFQLRGYLEERVRTEVDAGSVVRATLRRQSALVPKPAPAPKPKPRVLGPAVKSKTTIFYLGAPEDELPPAPVPAERPKRL